MVDFGGHVVLFAGGLVAGVLNVLAGGGSFLTLPILIFMGLPPIVANGTNRVGILFQNIGAVWGFHRHQVLDWRSLVWAALPASVGSLAGVWIAFSVGDAAFQRILAFLMIAVTLWTLWNPLKKRSAEADSSEGPRTQGVTVALLFFLVGIYGGFVQAGVGFFILAVTTWANLDLVRGNAIKVLCILAFTLISLGIFAWQGKVEWVPGLVLAAGTTLGGQVGVKLAILKGHRWLQLFVTVTIVLFALKLWLAG